MILVTGATGKTGGEVTRQLLAQGTPVGEPTSVEPFIRAHLAVFQS
jgi:uncharacterized protein YbjT (DUF2867 family)